MKKKALVAAVVSVIIAGVILSTGIVNGNKNKTEVKDNQPSTSISEQVEQTPETSETAESNIGIIEDETSISDDGLTSSNAGGSSEPVEVEITEDGVVAPYPDEYSLITQPEDKSDENSAESGVIKDVGNSINIVDETEKTGLPDSVKTELPELTDKDMDEFMQMVEDAGSPTIH